MTRGRTRAHEGNARFSDTTPQVATSRPVPRGTAIERIRGGIQPRVMYQSRLAITVRRVEGLVNRGIRRVDRVSSARSDSWPLGLRRVLADDRITDCIFHVLAKRDKGSRGPRDD
jgi:hypothetical protein